MKNKLLKLTILSTLMLTGCISRHAPSSSSSESSNDSSEIEEYKDERDYTYVNRLEEPSSTVHNMYDLSMITDYHAFYKDVDNFDVTLASDYVYSTSQETVDSEMYYLYWYGELLNGVLGYKGREVNSTTWNIEYTYYHNAHVDGHPTRTMLKDLAYKQPVQTRSNDYNDFATEDANKPVLDVATTQQLWFAAEWGYRINPIPGSPAEKYYNKAKQALRQIISDDMDDYTKITAIYDYIEHNATYCYEALDTFGDVPDPKDFPDVECAQHKAFFIEGFFDNHTVVCDGFSKVYTLLGRMEGLNIYRASGTSDTAWISKEVAGHAYCFVEVDGKYHLSCPTWGQISPNGVVVTEKTYFLAPEDYIHPYECTAWENLDYTTTSNDHRYFEDHSFTYGNDTYDLVIDSEDDFTPCINYVKSQAGSYLNVYCESSYLNDFYSAAYYAGFEPLYMGDLHQIILCTD